MSVLEPLNVGAIANLHAERLSAWKRGQIESLYQGFLSLVEANHSFNYQLWQAEDKARRDDLGHSFVYDAKRAIDGFNQARNNGMEAMDEWLFEHLKPADTGPVHSETPGMIIDRLSILALKFYHMDLESRRQNADEAHRLRCQAKVLMIARQKEQLLVCLQELLNEVKAKTRTFRIYRQFKMYNDPDLNPELYTQLANLAQN